MREYQPETCIDPWLGLLFLVFICLSVSGALWFLSKKPQQLSVNPSVSAPKAQATMKAAFQPMDPMISQTMGDKIIF